MGKFDGYLICSDIDGTFSCGGEQSIEINSEAVKYFTSNGGKFTFATGRGLDHVKRPEFFSNMNAPACLYNGALVYDIQNEKALREGTLDFTEEEFHLFVKENFREIYADAYYFSKGTNPLKIVGVFKTTSEADEFRSFAENASLFKNCYISKSWNAGVELTAKDYTKGTAAAFIKSSLFGVHTLVGVGDQENDITLLLSSDIGVATGNAVESLKKVADLIVCHAENGAIAEIISMLDEKI